MSDSETVVKELLKIADIKVNGKRPFDIQIHDERFYNRVLAHQSLGLGESYMDGWWDVKELDQMVARLLNAKINEKLKFKPTVLIAGARAVATDKLTNRQSLSRAVHNASHHYNIGNDLYERMLDERMIYTCAYWRNAKNLDEAQEAKLKLICEKLQLKKGMTVLDIGCGWGGFAKYAAQNYGVKVTGITLATEQAKLAKENTKEFPVDIQIKDYREVKGKYDRVVSIGMFEAVGQKNYMTFFNKCTDLLEDDGIMFHHTIGSNVSVKNNNPFMEKYIFPGGSLPSLADINKATAKTLVIEDLQNIGPDYVKTLLAWDKNFNKHYDELKDKYDETFKRMWDFYLLSFAGSFKARHVQLWQIVFRKIRTSETYVGVR